MLSVGIVVGLLTVSVSIVLYRDLNKSPVKQHCGFFQLERSETAIKGARRNG